MTAVVRNQATRASREVAAHGTAGFTLVELLIVIAIISILASIALPQYQEYVTRSRIPDATSSLANKRARVELFYDNNRTYAGAPDCATDSTTSRYFTFTGNCTVAGYTLTATGTGAMSGFVYTINQANAKATTGAPSGWGKSATCWTIRKDGSC